MFIKKFYNNLSKDNKEHFVGSLVGSLVGGLVWGIVSGLVSSLVLGLVWGIFWGLVSSLVWGLVWGLVGSLVVGLIWGLVVGLVWSQYGFNNTFIMVLGIIVFVLMEVMYFISNKNNTKKIGLWQVLWLKVQELFEILLVVINLLNIWFICGKINISWKQEYNGFIMRFLGYFGIIVIIISLFIGYLWINKYLITRKVRKTK